MGGRSNSYSFFDICGTFTICSPCLWTVFLVGNSCSLQEHRPSLRFSKFSAAVAFHQHSYIISTRNFPTWVLTCTTSPVWPWLAPLHLECPPFLVEKLSPLFLRPFHRPVTTGLCRPGKSPMALKIFEIDSTLRGCEGQIWDRVNGYRRKQDDSHETRSIHLRFWCFVFGFLQTLLGFSFQDTSFAPNKIFVWELLSMRKSKLA